MAAPSSSQYDVFLSHSSVVKPAVEELALWLVREGVNPFLDKWHLVPGEDWMDALPQALGDSTACAVIIGPGAKGGWQTEEVKQAILRRVRERHQEARDRFRIIPVLLPGAKAPGTGEPSAFDFLAEYTWVQFDRTLDEDEPQFRLVCGIRGVPPGPRPGVPIVTGECPYRGLQIFDVAYAELFFGREKLTLDLVEMLRDQITSPGPRLLAVVGPSGSGKSSVVRAGLTPVLERGALEGSAMWHRLIFKPGQDPFENLGIELAKLPGGAGLLADTRSFLGIDRFGRDHARSLHTAAKLALRDDPPSARLLVVADQFEEVFTLCKSEEDRRALIDNLLEAAMIPDGPVVLVLAIRADFLGKCAGYRRLADEISGRQKLIGKMEEDELRWAIEKPAVRAGGEIDPGLVELLLRDVGSDPGTLPLLEFALTQLWAQKTGRRMTVADYEAIGGLKGALKQRADTILADLRKRGQEDICRRIFLDLIEPGEGTEDTRRRVAYGQLAAPPQWSEVVETLVRERLVTADNPDDLKEGSIEIVHEALIQKWTTLQDWINADRKSMVIRTDLEAAANKWIKNSQHPDFLLAGLLLANAQDWAKTHPDDLTRLSQVAQFLVESQKAEDKSKADEIAAARRLAEEAEARRQAEEDRAREAELREQEQAASAINLRRRAWLLLVISIAAILGAVIAVLGWLAAREASDEAKRQTWIANANAAEAKEQRRIAQEASRQAKHQSHVANVIAADAAMRVGEFDAAAARLDSSDSAERRIEWFLLKQYLDSSAVTVRGTRGAVRGVKSVVFSPDGLRVVTGCWDRTVRVWDARSGALVHTLLGHSDPVMQARFSRDARTIVSVSLYEDVRVWDAETGALTRTFRVSDKPKRGSGPRVVADLAADASRVCTTADGATKGAAKTVRVWDVRTGAPVETLTAPAATDSVFLPVDGTRILGIERGDSSLTVRDLRTGKPVVNLTGLGGRPGTVAFTPDGARAMAGCSDKKIYVIEVDTGKRLWDLGGLEGVMKRSIYSGLVTSLTFGPARRTAVAGTNYGPLFVWDLGSGRLVAKFWGHREAVEALAVSPDGSRIASGARDSTMRFWDVSHAAVTFGHGHHAAVSALAFSRDGKLIATGNESVTDDADEPVGDDSICLWDTASRAPVRVWRAHLDQVQAVCFSPDGTRLVAGGTNQAVRLWDVRTGVLLGTFHGHNSAVEALAYDEGGGALATGTWSGVVRVWDTGSGKLRWAARGHEKAVDDLAFSPDATLLASASWDKTVKVWDARSGSELFTLPGHRDQVCSVRFSRDGSRLLSGSCDGLCVLWDVKARTVLRRIQGPGSLLAAELDGDGKRVIAALDDKTVRVWDAETDEALLTLRDCDAEFKCFAVSPDGTAVAVGTSGLGLAVWGAERATARRVVEVEPGSKEERMGIFEDSKEPGITRESLVQFLRGRRSGLAPREAPAFEKPIAVRGEESPEAFLERGRAYLHRGDYDLAIADFDRAIGLRPGYSEAYGARGIARYFAADVNAARRDMESALRFESGKGGPDHGIYKLLLGHIAFKQERYDDAIQAFGEVIAERPSAALPYHLRALCHIKMNDYDKALRDYDEAVKRDGRDVQFRLGRGKVLHHLGTRDRGLGDITEAVRIQPGSGEAHYDYACTLFESKRFREALDHFQQAADLSPGEPPPGRGQGDRPRRSGAAPGGDGPLRACGRPRPRLLGLPSVDEDGLVLVERGGWRRPAVGRRLAGPGRREVSPPDRHGILGGADTGEKLLTLGNSEPGNDETAFASSMAFSKDSKLLAVGAGLVGGRLGWTLTVQTQVLVGT